ncbi:MAG: hypothetical protein EBR82_46810 [Caulobacteraceae bacterium]|nr:hypothetical protein [Caulobacteraceae bacterium]
MKRHARGQAFCRWMAGGASHQRWFGPWGSAEARANYAAFCREWIDKQEVQEIPRGGTKGGTVADLVDAWLSECKVRCRKFGRLTSSWHTQRQAMKGAMEILGERRLDALQVYDFEAVQRYFISLKLTTETINKYFAVIGQALRFGVPRGYGTLEIVARYGAVRSLRVGQGEGAEREPVVSVDGARLNAVLSYLESCEQGERGGTLARMIRLQISSGLRPGEVCALRWDWIHTDLGTWRCIVPDRVNKTAHRGKKRVVLFGPNSRAILLGQQGQGQGNSSGVVFLFDYERKQGKRELTRDVYARWIREACDTVGVPRWHPHQLRHNRATAVREAYSSAAAAAAAIGTTLDVAAEIYCDPSELAARKIAEEMG